MNNDYGTYTYAENGDIVVMEVVDQNPEYEQTAGKGDQAANQRRPLSDYENWEDDYDYMGENREQSAKKRRQLSEDEYDQMG